MSNKESENCYFTWRQLVIWPCCRELIEARTSVALANTSSSGETASLAKNTMPKLKMYLPVCGSCAWCVAWCTWNEIILSVKAIAVWGAHWEHYQHYRHLHNYLPLFIITALSVMLTGINAGGDVSLSVCCVYYADTFKKCFDDVFHFDQQHR